MFKDLVSYIDIPIVIILMFLIIFSTFFIKNSYNIFLTIFVEFLLLIFIGSTILLQQRFLCEFLIISTFFMLTIVFFIFNLGKVFNSSLVFDDKIPIYKYIFVIILFILIFLIIGFNFDKINHSKTNLIVETSDKLISKTDNSPEYYNYIENVSLLNQNKIFQKFTHIIIFYISLTVILYFFNRNSERNGNEW